MYLDTEIQILLKGIPKIPSRYCPALRQSYQNADTRLCNGGGLANHNEPAVSNHHALGSLSYC